ncbi:hypothetical protein [Paenibacillus agricola]|uniref:DUF3888 domain-containing protein n=1 Tax=Paenibacillus agricola TaxID=2716264 RepID=A0ABX0JLC1_9BACL|nr:hypothetical protein [Paenibacillus agricola]NHN35499.1 hypothetical protein [Paenibacillus agricola]
MNSKTFAFFLLALLLASCVGIASAASITKADLNEGIAPISATYATAVEALDSYLTNVVTTKPKGWIPLKSYEIINVDESIPQQTKITVVLTYEEFGEMPAVDYIVKKENGEYKVVERTISFTADGKVIYGGAHVVK